MVLLAAPSLGQADWSVRLGTGAYLGRLQVGAGHLFSDRHEWLVSYGQTEDEILGQIRQYNLTYAYRPWEIQWGPWFAAPFKAGFFATSTDRDEFFLQSPERYPEDFYYDPTKVRTGLRLGFDVGRELRNRQKLVAGFDLSVLDQGLLIAWNEGWRPAVSEFLSVGMSLSFQFE